MKTKFLQTTLFTAICILFMQSVSFAQTTDNKKVSWEDKFEEVLPYLGHRNWILVVDAAYPLQSSSAIQTIIADDDIEKVTKKVLNYVAKAPHVKPIVYQDKEFSFMRDAWSKNCQKLYADMYKLLAPYAPNVILHDEIFEKLDSASKLFNVVVIKTDCVTPYSSVFIELDCGYWTGDSEAALRKSME